MKKRKSREQSIDELRAADSNFQRLYAKVLERNGGRIPSSEEIGRRLDARIERGRGRGDS